MTHVATILRLVGIHDGHRYDHKSLRSVALRLLPLKLGIFQGSPGGTILDLHDPWLGVTSAFGEESHCFVFTESVKGSLEQDHPILALAVDRNATRARKNVICNRVGE